MSVTHQPRKKNIFGQHEIELLGRCYDAIKGGSQMDIVKLQNEIAERFLGTYACAEALDMALSRIGNDKRGDPTTLKQVLEQRTGKEDDGLTSSDKRYRKQVAYLSIVWSPVVLQYYGWNDEGLSKGKARALYHCAQAYNDFGGFVRHYNVFVWLRHLDTLTKMVRREKHRFSATDWADVDLKALSRLKNGEDKRITRYGEDITLPTLEEYQHEIDEATRKRDGVVTLDGRQVDLEIWNPGGWGVYLIRYDKCGRIKQRDESNGTAHRLDLISPPASTARPTNWKNPNGDGADVPAFFGNSGSGSTGTSTQVSSPQSITQKSAGFGRCNSSTSSTYPLHAGVHSEETTLFGTPASDDTDFDKGDLTCRGQTVPGDSVADLAEITLTDDEGSEVSVVSGRGADESGTARQSGYAAESSPTDELRRAESMESVTHTTAKSAPMIGAATASLTDGVAVSTKLEQCDDGNGISSDLDRAIAVLDGADADVVTIPGSTPLSILSLQSLLVPSPSQEVRNCNDTAPQYQVTSDIGITGYTATTDQTPSDRPTPSLSQACSAQGLFLSERSHRSESSTPKRPSTGQTRPASSSYSNDGTDPPRAVTTGHNPRDGESNPTKTKSTDATSSSTSPTTSTCSSSSGQTSTDSAKSGGVGSTAPHSDAESEHPTHGESAVLTTPFPNINLWREACASPVDGVGTTDLYGLRNALLRNCESDGLYDPPSLRELSLYGSCSPNSHRNPRLAECDCEVCGDLQPVLQTIRFQASASDASNHCRARDTWLKNAWWASAVDLDACAGLPGEDSEAFVASYFAFKSKTRKGIILDKPVIVRECHSDGDAYNMEGLRQVLFDRFSDCSVEVADVRAHDSKTLSMKDFLAEFSSDEEPVGCSKIPESLEAGRPAFLKHPRFCLLRSAISRATCALGSSDKEVFDRVAAFTRIEAAGFFAAPRIGTFGGTWLRVLEGELLCVFAPRAQTTSVMYGEFAREDLTWQPAGKQKLVLLKKNEVLFLPPGIICAHLVVKDCISLEGSFWDEQETGRYATATLLTPKCNPPRVADEVPQTAIDHVLKGLALIVNADESRFEADIFYRGNGQFGLPLETTAQVIESRSPTASAAVAVSRDQRAAKGIRGRADTYVKYEAPDEVMEYF
ncbi:hypothetical protein KC353_g89 [Hortaea werneckii]|nr:hypothetical protein KC353_g89 [Hortaea werneckii]